LADKPIRIAAICGTVRPGNYTSHALALAVDQVNRSDKASAALFNPGELRLGFPGEKVEHSDASKLQDMVDAATGVILATPEYHGSFSAYLKLVIENLGFPSRLAGKPVALLGVAAGQIGAIKSLEQLRSVCSHVGAIVLPGPVSVAGVQRVFNEQGVCLDEKVEARVRGVGDSLIHYVQQNICPRMALEHMVRD